MKNEFIIVHPMDDHNKFLVVLSDLTNIFNLPYFKKRAKLICPASGEVLNIVGFAECDPTMFDSITRLNAEYIGVMS